MSMNTGCVLVCDGGCGAELPSRYNRVRHDAEREGWKWIDEQDLCPVCANQRLVHPGSKR